ncbi:MAG TPA: dTMP kinase, partial [Candidatus Acidoferrales bacterium]|nr:dTMP kinase [Candidatus Acidoferrales bacterium]
IEGSGKSTLLSGLSDRLRSRGREIFVTREPGGTPVGDAIRALFLDRDVSIAPLTEALLVNAARAQHVADRIRPELAAGRIVLCDRFVDSTMAYQGYGRGVDLGVLRSMCDAATGGLVPDLTFVLDVPLALSRSRTVSRGRAVDRLEAEDDGFHQRVRDGFLELARGPRYRILDGTLPQDELVDRALGMIGNV